MVKARDIAKFLNKELNVRKIKDSSVNGLQVNDTKEIKKVGFAVDSCISTFEMAKKENVDLLIVHHGLKWKPKKRTFAIQRRENYLKKNKIALYGCHLPLDIHKKYGNGIILANMIGLNKTKNFGKYQGIFAGLSGKFKNQKKISEISKILNKKTNTKCRVFQFGKSKIKSIGIVSGGGGFAIEDAIKEKIDCLLTGEAKLSEYILAKEYRINLIVAGHYATETVGVKVLMPLIREKFKIKTTFIDDKKEL